MKTILIVFLCLVLFTGVLCIVAQALKARVVISRLSYKRLVRLYYRVSLIRYCQVHFTLWKTENFLESCLKRFLMLPVCQRYMIDLHSVVSRRIWRSSMAVPSVDVKIDPCDLSVDALIADSKLHNHFVDLNSIPKSLNHE